jgi:hypothetical protein
MNGSRRAALAAAAAVAATLYVAVGGAAAATPATVSGSGTVGTGYNPIAFTIDASGVGPDATGTVHYEQGQSVITGHVVCLAASPTDAEIVTQIDSSTVPAGEGGAVGNAMQIDVTGGAAGSTFSAMFGPLAPHPQCWTDPELAFPNPLATGTISISGGDPTPPVVTPTVSGQLGQNGWYTGDVSVSWNVSEPESWLAFAGGCDDVNITTDVLGEPLTCDAASGGGRTKQSVVIKRDATPPAIVTTSRTPANAAGWNDTPVVATFGCSDMTSFVASCPKTVTFDQEGTNLSRTVTASDNAGNTANDTVSHVNIDLTPPTLTGTPLFQPNANGWYRTAVPIRWACHDALSGLVACPSDTGVSGEGAGLVSSLSIHDVAGNVTTATSLPVNIDHTPPLTSAAAPVGWSKTAVTVALSALDNLSGVDATYAEVDGGTAQATDSVSISGDGNHTLSYWSVDKAGNVEPERTITVQIDTSAPTITHTVAPMPNASGWNASDVTVAFQCSDSVSGVASCAAPQIVTGEGASLRVTGRATNNAGWSTDDTALVSIDRTPPTISASADRAPNANGWYGDDVVVNFACADALSGISSCAAPVTFGEGAGQSAAGNAADIAGNTASATLNSIDVDKTAPVVNYSGNQGTYSIADTVNIACSATDALSGIATSTCADLSGPAWQFGLGVTSRSASATDLAGNGASGSVTFTVTATASSIESVIGQLVSDQTVVSSLVAKVDSVAAASNTSAKANKVAAFDNEIDAQTGKSISADQAALLKQLIAAL